MEIKQNEGGTKQTEFILMVAHFLPCTECVYKSYIHLEKLILVI